MIVRILAVFTLMFLTLSCGNLSESPSKKEKTTPSYLFVFMANHGSISKNPQGEFTLTLEHANIEKVLAFSDRPFRIVKHITGKELKELWTQGNNSFAKDNPNASIIINQHLQTVILSSINISEDTFSFSLKQDGPQPIVSMDGVTQLFIDGGKHGVSTDVNPSSFVADR